jgi:hypothetical protein
MKPRIRMFLHFKNGKVGRYYSGGIRRFTTKLRGCSPAKIDILVKYGKDIDVHGNYTEFYNQYVGDNVEDAIKALKAFCEH